MRLREELQRAARYDQSVGFAVFEFAAEKSALDALGEFAIGELLLQASAVVRETVRKADIVGRYGHTTLGLLLPYAGEHAPSIAERVAVALDEWLQAAFSPHARAVPHPLRLGVLSRRLRGLRADDSPCRAAAAGASGAGAPDARRGVEAGRPRRALHFLAPNVP